MREERALLLVMVRKGQEGPEGPEGREEGARRSQGKRSPQGVEEAQTGRKLQLAPVLGVAAEVAGPGQLRRESAVLIPVVAAAVLTPAAPAPVAPAPAPAPEAASAAVQPF